MQEIELLADLGKVFIASLLLEARYSNKPDCQVAAIAARITTFWKNRPLRPKATPAAPAAAAAPAGTFGATASGGAAPAQARQGASGAATAGAAAGAGTLQREGPSSAAIFIVMRELEARRLLTVTHRERGWYALLSLNVPAEDAVHVLQQSERIAWVHGALGAAA